MRESPAKCVRVGRSGSNSQSRRPIRSSNESAPSTYVRISVSAKDGHYHEVASLHVRIITKRASNSRNAPGGGGG